MTYIGVVNDMKVCFIGYRRMEVTRELRSALYDALDELVRLGATEFLFGERSRFDDLCYEAVTRLKSEYYLIRRVRFRVDEADACRDAGRHPPVGYEACFTSVRARSTWRVSGAELNQAMIRESDACVFYYDPAYISPRRAKRPLDGNRPRGGIAIAYAYAEKLGKRIINLCPNA